jgi:LEA14-like dessication related protein
MKNYKPILILAGVSIIGYSLYRYYMKQLTFLQDITYQVIGVRIRSITTSSVSMDITTRIYNASNVEATVKEMYLDVFMNDIKVGNVNEVKDILILPSKTTDISFNFSFNPRLIGKNLLDIISSTVQTKDINFELKGYIKVKSSFLTPTIPFEYQNNLKNLINKK